MQLCNEMQERTENPRAGPPIYTVIDYGDYEVVDVTGEPDDEDKSKSSVGAAWHMKGLG